MLILRGDRLYGIGSNESGQLGGFDEENLTELRLIARDVKTAAVGVHYSIYITQSGHIEVLGRGKYADRPIKISNATEVYADSRDADTFWIRDSSGELFGFGDNDNAIEETTAECLYEFPEKIYNCTCAAEKSISHGPGPSNGCLSLDTLFSRIPQEYESTAIYKQLIKANSDRYVYLDSGIQRERCNISFYGEPFETHCRAVATPKIMRSNQYIFQPVRAREFGTSHPYVYYNLTGIPAPVPDFFQNKAYQKILYGIIFGEAIERWRGRGDSYQAGIFALDTEGILSVYKNIWNSSPTFIGTIPGVCDIASCSPYTRISTTDGRLISGIVDESSLHSGNGTAAFEEITFPKEE